MSSFVQKLPTKLNHPANDGFAKGGHVQALGLLTLTFSTILTFCSLVNCGEKKPGGAVQDTETEDDVESQCSQAEHNLTQTMSHM